MNTKDHARILYAYIGRLTDTDLADILKKREAAADAKSNLGLNAQLEAQEKTMLAVESAVGRLQDSDKAFIERVVKSAKVE